MFVTLSKPQSPQLSDGVRRGFREHLGNFLIRPWISWRDMSHRQSALLSLCFSGAQVHMSNTQGKCHRCLLSAPVCARNKSMRS